MTFKDSRLGGAGWLGPSSTPFLLRRTRRAGSVLAVQPASGGYRGLLPDATKHRPGFPFMVLFAIANGFEVWDSTNAVQVGTLAAGEAAEVGLADASTPTGAWTFRKATVPPFIPFLTGTKLSGRVREVAGSTGPDWVDYPVTLLVDTAAKVATGGMEADGSDMEWRDHLDNVLDFEIVSGMNTASTEIVVVVPLLRRMGHSRIYMYSGDFILGAGGPTITGPHSQPAAIQPEFDVMLFEGFTSGANFNPLSLCVGFGQTPPADWLREDRIDSAGAGPGYGTVEGGPELTAAEYEVGRLRVDEPETDYFSMTQAGTPPFSGASQALGDNGDFAGAPGFNNPG